MKSDEGRVNFILVDICSARADHFGLYGYARPTTPNIDGLARESVVFDGAMSQSSWCLPNYATLFTGQRPEAHGLCVNDASRTLPASSELLAEGLRGAGYKTAAFSGGVYMLPAWGFARGFDVYVNKFSPADPVRIPAPVDDNLPAVYDWLDARAKDKAPFFLYIAIDDTHTPYRADRPEMFDEGYAGPCDPETRTVPFARAYSGQAAGYPDAVGRKATEFKKDIRHLAHHTAHYDAALHSADERVGRVLRRLSKAGLDSSTMVVVTADHGEMLGEKGLLAHTEGLYEPILRVPLVIRDPALPGRAGARARGIVERADIMPTILERAGAAPSPRQGAGQSFLELLRGHAPASWREAGYASSKRNVPGIIDRFVDERALRGARWKLVWSMNKKGFELYDLSADGGETRDAAPENPGIARDMAFSMLKEAERSRF
ncbi:MAG TPA: sulfatase [Elusimicrobiota bacterium]|nr:sulfatase [Elusimicrobiota bacterium]